MKEIYYDKYDFCDYLKTEMLCEGEIVNMNSVEKVKVKFPNGETEVVEYLCVDEYVCDRDCGLRDMNFIFKFEYKGIYFKETARSLIEKGCRIFIETTN